MQTVTNMNTLQCISPIDGSVYAERPLASPNEVEAALSRAKAAQQTWRRIPLAERAQYCHRMLDYFLANVSDIATELTWQMGRPIRYSPMEIQRGFAERTRHMIAIAAEALADVAVEPKENFTRFIRHDPLGIVFTVAPWNYPYLTSVNSIIPALLAGNAVILKHSEQTLLCAERYSQAFAAAGLPDGIFQHLHTNHAGVANIIADPRIEFVAFTGSVAGGYAIQQAASRRFIATGLELGGKDPAYVRADADLAFAIENVVDGAFFNSGQSCCGIERVYVHEQVYDAFVEGAVALTRQYTLGNPLDSAVTLGPMVRTRAADLVREHIQEAVAKGAKALIDPAEFPANQPGTPYLAPQILVDVDHTMKVMVEESFGPVVGIMRVKDDAEAISLMNDSPYGLTASIWTQDEETAVSIGDHIETGTWYMNRCDYLDPALAWTGVKDSGRGCTLSVLGFDCFTRPKSFHLRTKTS